jgi:hypothetical protein
MAKKTKVTTWGTRGARRSRRDLPPTREALIAGASLSADTLGFDLERPVVTYDGGLRTLTAPARAGLYQLRETRG